MLCLLAAGRLGGVLSFTLAQLVESAGEDNGNLLSPTRWTFESLMVRWIQTGGIQLNLIGTLDHELAC